ncbi:hypothetical protein IAU60_005158 [Kwoniella sp. DSM 27419]
MANASRDHRQYNLSPMLTSSSVYWALSNRAYTADPEYVKAVIRSYVYFKVERRKTPREISSKLHDRESEWPQFASAFAAIRQEYRLPGSDTYLDLYPRDSSLSNRVRPSSSGVIYANSLRRTQTSVDAARPATLRRPQAEDEDPPPPPYAHQDPEPDATRTLQERLAAEAEAAGSITAEPPRTSGSNAQAGPSNHASPPRRVSPHTNGAAQSSNAPDDGPSPQPTDPEMARIWEESQFEEAKRASIAWQREQDELQQALDASIAEAEAAEAQATMEESDRAGSSTRPTSSTTGWPGGPQHEDIGQLVSGMEDMAIPDGWRSDAQPSAAYPQPTSTTEQGSPSLLDQPDEVSQGPAPISPQKTGFALKSKNPFLSRKERQEAQAEEDNAAGNGPGSSRTIYNPPNGGPTATPSLADGVALTGERPRSSHTQDAPQTPPLGDVKHAYAPPPGPPPAHLRMPSSSLPSSPSARPLPAPPRESSSRVNGMNSLATPIADMMRSQQGSALTSQQPSALGAPPALPPRRSSFAPPKGKEDPLEMLREYDTVFLVDDSTSMAGERWSEARLALMEVAEIAARYDENGVDIYFLNSKRVGKELKAADEVEDLFRGLTPKGATPIGLRLETILRNYMSRLERSQASSPGAEPLSPGIEGIGTSEEIVKAMNLIVVTDGAPTDDPESVIINCAKRLDRGEFPLSQVGIQFLQIGDDSEAREALQELDDGLSSAHGVRDMVDTVLYAGEEMTAGLIIKALLGGINRRLDRRSSA